MLHQYTYVYVCNMTVVRNLETVSNWLGDLTFTVGKNNIKLQILQMKT